MVARGRAGLAQGPVGARKTGHIALTQMLRHGTGLASDPSTPQDGALFWCWVYNSRPGLLGKHSPTKRLAKHR